jgi:hypothetical protein
MEVKLLVLVRKKHAIWPQQTSGHCFKMSTDEHVRESIYKNHWPQKYVTSQFNEGHKRINATREFRKNRWLCEGWDKRK